MKVIKSSPVKMVFTHPHPALITPIITKNAAQTTTSIVHKIATTKKRPPVPIAVADIMLVTKATSSEHVSPLDIYNSKALQGNMV